jgi:two-component system, chemotaxis family, chemotaxis protein CheY
MQKRILIVDDSESIRHLLSAILQSAGFEVCAAIDGQDAIERFNTSNFNLVLTDLNMPRVDGISLIKHIRKSNGASHVPIIMITTESQTTIKDQAKSAGATGWIVKPFVAEKLLTIVSKVLR